MPNKYNYGQFDDDLLEALQAGYSGDDLNELFGDVNLSEWAGSNLAFDEAAGADQLRYRNARIGGEQALRELKSERLFEQAGVPKSQMPKGRQSLQDVLGRLNSDNPNGVIGPFVQSGRTSKGAEFSRRFHTREVESPFVKGRMEVRPFVNPETKKPLISTFANANEFQVPGLNVDSRWQNANPSWIDTTRKFGIHLKPQVGDRATELVTKHVGWLAGRTDLRAANNVTPDDFLNSRNPTEFKKHKSALMGADYEFLRDGKSGDAEVIFGNPRAQIYANIYDPPDTIKREVFSNMGSNNNNLFDAINDLNRQGRVGRVNAGKVIKNYTIIQPQYDQEYLGRNTNRGLDTFRNDKITQPPKKVFAIDGPGVVRDIKNAGSNLNPDRVQFTPNNYGGGARTYYSPPVDGTTVKDISRTGAVPQILDELDYKVKPQPVVKSTASKTAELSPTALERMQAIEKEATRRTRTRSSAIPKGEVGAVNAGLVDGAGRGLIRGRIGGLTNVALNGASRETGIKLAEGDYTGAATEFGRNYAIGAAADVGLRKAGQAILTRLPAALAKGAAGTVSSGGWAAPMAAAYTAYEVADGAVEGFTGKGLSTRMEEASDDAVTSAYERKFNQPAPKGGFVPKDKPLVQAKPQRAPTSLENINSAVKAVSEIAPEVKAQPAQITQATPQVTKPDTGNFLSQWTNKVRSWFK